MKSRKMPPASDNKLKARQSITNHINRSFSRVPFSRSQLMLFGLVFAVVGGYLLWRSFAATPPLASIEAEHMSLPAGASVISDSHASGGQAVVFKANGSATATVSLPSQATSGSVVVRASSCFGWPSLVLSADGKTLLQSTGVNTTTWTSLSFSTNLAAGSHNLSLYVGNIPSNNECAQRLYADIIYFYGPAPATTPAPTISLSASPASVTAGAFSTLTWASTNATACSASGAWSGSQPTSGSFNTGALNANSTYSLTCTGTGGSANASATVTVSSGGWTFCASEGGNCSFTGTMQVRYGANGIYVTKTYTGGTPCTNTAFGTDPVPGVYKHCDRAPATTATTGTYSSSRWVYGMGTKDATYLGSQPGWWSNGTSTGWVRLPSLRADNNHIDFIRDGSVDLMAGMLQSINGWNNTGTSAAPTVRLTLYPTDTDDKGGYTLGTQQHDAIQAYDHRQSPNGSKGSDVEQSTFGSQPDFGAAPGQDWYYGWTVSTNSGFTPTTSNTGWWNSLHDFHPWNVATPGGNSEVAFAIATRGPQGATAGTVYTVKDNASYLLSDGPHIGVNINGGNADATNYATGTDLTMYRIIGPKWVAGQQYKIAYHVKWDAYLNGTFEWWVNGVKYGSLTNIGTLWRTSTGTLDTPYPQWENYRAYDPNNTATNSIYYGALIKGSSLYDVTIP